ncbi:unnamed protein product [Paramecium pentaurelia]|uniref:Uncharacterized protein n=1 Tax=Paramecium pentaurelia TaxID=43138 RepID=A0A8S1V6Z5_9CILI|nr:unnamed protein product [Paramecium pentaurelia]
MQQTVSLFAGMTKVFKSANNNKQYQETCKCQKENFKVESQNKEHLQEFSKKHSTNENQKENIMIQSQPNRK